MTNDTSDGELHRLIQSRRTIHDFIPERVPDQALIRRILEVATWSPNHHHTRPWKFYFPGPDSTERICQLHARSSGNNPRASAIRLARWRAMPALLIMSCTASEDTVRAREDYAACCCTVQNMMLLLWQQGVGMKWSTNEIIREPEFHKILGIPSGTEEIVGLFWYGYPATIPKSQHAFPDHCVLELP